jgi:hypothetical protein
MRWARRTPDSLPDPREDHHSGIDFRIQRQIKAYEKTDDPPRRVKPVPIIIIVFILQMAYDEYHDVASLAIAEMICIYFFFLLRPGEFTGTTLDDTSFCLQDVGIYIRYHKLELFQCSDSDLDAATSVWYTFTTHKNGTRDEKIVQGRSCTSLCCPIRATVRCIKHNRLKK